jgi:hypothetical protein
MLFRLIVTALLLVGLPVLTPLPNPVAARADDVVATAGTTPEASGADPTVIALDVVVPPVSPTSGQVEETDELQRAQAAGDVITADHVTSGQRVESGVVETDNFQTVAVTWPGNAQADTLGAQVRTRAGAEWSGWVPLEADDSAPDVGTADATTSTARGGVRGGTDSVWVGDADAVQLSFSATPAGGPSGLKVTLVSSDATAAGTATRVASTSRGATITGASYRSAAYRTAPLTTAVSAPRIISRAEWGARPEACAPDVASTLLAAVVHHTAGSNDYQTVAQAMQQIRNDQAYHIDGRGWCDIGYNFIVDKWGNIYEGRANSASQPVIGVHAGGFNTATVGIAMLGSYDTVAPPAALQESVAQVIAWRLGAYYRDPLSTVGYTTWGGETSRFPAGTRLALPVVVGHRDVDITACPGNSGYTALGWIKSRARQLIGATFVNPIMSATSVPIGGAVSVTGGVLSAIDWTLQVVDERTGVELSRTVGATGPSGGGAIATWDGRTSAGLQVGPGPYRLSLTGTERGTGAPVKAWSGSVEVTGSQNPTEVQAVPLAYDLRFVPVTPARLLDTRLTGQSLGPASRMDLQVAGLAGIPADAKAVALNVTTVASSRQTFVRVWPAGQPMSGASALNTDEARTTGAGVMVGIGGQGMVSIYNNLGSTHVVVDVTGYYTDAAGEGSSYTPMLTGVRLLDTRLSGGQMSDQQRRTVQVGGVGGIPADASAVVLNVSSVMATGAGNISAFPSGGPVPGTASVNHLPGQDVSNRTVVPLTGGQLDLVLSGARADVVLDAVGWFGPGATLSFTPIIPARAFDTRLDGGTLSAGETRTFSVGATTGLPGDAAAAVVAIAATQQTALATFVTLWPDGIARPITSDLNTGAGRDQANLAVVPLTSGRLQAYNNAGTVQLVVDVFGYFR